MKIAFTNHAHKKFSDFKVFGIVVTKTQVLAVVMNPKYKSRDNGNKISASTFDERHNVRVVHKEVKGDIIIITFYINRKGRYGEY